MENIIRKGKQSYHNRNSSKLIFNNLLLNKLNLESIQSNYPSISSNSRSRKNSDIPISVKKNNKNIFKEYSIEKNILKNINNKNNLTPFKNDNYLPSTNSFLNKKGEDNNSYIILKNYILGNDIILPLKSINDIENSKIPYYTINNFNKINTISPIRNKSIKLFNKKKNKKQLKKYLLKNKEKEFSNSNLNINDNNNNNLNNKLFNKNNMRNFSSKNLNNYYKQEQDYLNKIGIITQIKEKKKNNKTFEIGNSNFVMNNNDLKIKKKNNFNTYNILNKKKNILLNNNIYNNKIFEDKKISMAFNLGKKLINNPESVLYLLYNKIKIHKLNKEGNQRKYDLKQRFLDYKKDLNKLEQSARFELFNLKKQRAIGNEVNMKGKVISTNTFFNLAGLRGDF